MGFEIFIMFAILALLARFVAGNFDNDRIEQEINAKGGKLISKEWTPFGKGWVGEKNDRIYKVSYLDSEENVHEAYIKTSMFSGVYFTEDRIVKFSNSYNYRKEISEKEKGELILENEKLRAELEKLKKQ